MRFTIFCLALAMVLIIGCGDALIPPNSIGWSQASRIIKEPAIDFSSLPIYEFNGTQTSDLVSLINSQGDGGIYYLNKPLSTATTQIITKNNIYIYGKNSETVIMLSMVSGDGIVVTGRNVEFHNIQFYQTDRTQSITLLKFDSTGLVKYGIGSFDCEFDIGRGTAISINNTGLSHFERNVVNGVWGSTWYGTGIAEGKVTYPNYVNYNILEYLDTGYNISGQAFITHHNYICWCNTAIVIYNAGTANVDHWFDNDVLDFCKTSGISISGTGYEILRTKITNCHIYCVSGATSCVYLQHCQNTSIIGGWMGMVAGSNAVIMLMNHCKDTLIQGVTIEPVTNQGIYVAADATNHGLTIIGNAIKSSAGSYSMSIGVGVSNYIIDDNRLSKTFYDGGSAPKYAPAASSTASNLYVTD